MDRIHTVASLGGPYKVLQLVVPGGIGDISWIYSKIRHLKTILGRPVLLTVPNEAPLRGGDFIQLLPDVHWGGYVHGITSWQVISQSLPSQWPVNQGWGPFLPRGYPVNVAANLHLECGRSLADWLQPLPVDYHYPLNISAQDRQRADQLLAGLTRPIISVYVSNRDKDAIKAGGWNLWSVGQWEAFLTSVARLPECNGCSFVLLGAEWDRDKTEAVAGAMAGRAFPVRRVIAQPLGVALTCLQKSNYFFAFPSGIGILGNVLRVPGLMLLPWLLKNLETTYADPFDISTRRYRAWANPTPEEAFAWVRNVSMPQVLAENGGTWPAPA